MDPSNAVDIAEIERLAEPLVHQLKGSTTRLVARSTSVTIDDAHATARLIDARLDEQAFAELHRLLVVPVRLAKGVVALALPDAIVLERLAPIEHSAVQLAERGELSVLAARLLGAALQTGRNLLFTGPLDACLPLMGALIDEGQRPALLLGDSWHAHPPRWHLIDELSQAQRLGADVFAAWGLGHKALIRVMNQLTGVVGHIAGGRLERALTRFESGWNRPQQAPLGVLSSVDLVVVVQRGPKGPEVQSIAEILLAADGYRPQALFLRGQTPVPSALNPVARPSFVPELVQLGHRALAADLMHATQVHSAPHGAAMDAGIAPPPAAATSAAPNRIEPTDEGLFEQARRMVARPEGRPARARGGLRSTRPMQQRPLREPQAPPGWELDLPGVLSEGEELMALSEETTAVMPAPGHGPAGAEPAARPLSAEEANLAATFGLAPPPVPPNQSQVAMDLPAATGFGEQGDESLRHNRTKT